MFGFQKQMTQNGVEASLHNGGKNQSKKIQLRRVNIFRVMSKSM
jgi:hypothetical protein